MLSSQSDKLQDSPMCLSIVPNEPREQVLLSVVSSPSHIERWDREKRRLAQWSPALTPSAEELPVYNLYQSFPLLAVDRAELCQTREPRIHFWSMIDASKKEAK